MKLLRSFPVMAFALVLLSIAGFSAAQRSVEMFLVAGTLAAVSWYVTEGPRGRTLPRWASTMLVLLVTAAGVADFAVHPRDIPGVLGRFSLALTVVKLFDRRTARDHAHLMGLSLLLMLVGCMSSYDLLFGVFVAAYSLLGLYVLLLFQLFAAHERVTERRRRRLPAVAGTRRPPQLAPTIGRHVGLHFRGLAFVIAVVGLVSSTLLFVIFPRSLGRDLGRGARGGVTAAGFADRIDLDVGTRITDSRRVAFEMIVGDGWRGGPLYLRGAVLDDYRDGRWRATVTPAEPLGTDGRSIRWLARGILDPPETVRIELRFRTPTSTLFSPYVPVGVFTSQPRSFRFDPARQTLATDRDDPPVWTYAVIAQPEPPAPLVTALSGGRRRPARPFHTFDRPDEAARVVELAETLLTEVGHPRPVGQPPSPEWGMRAAEIFAAYLQTGGFTYTLDVSGVVRTAQDPVTEFLFNSRRGHCEYFASAHALLCRAVGVDARVVTGYIVPDATPGASSLVLESAAHAWVEVPIDDVRVATFDPTPPDALDSAEDPTGGLTARLTFLVQRLEGVWMNRVVQFDERSQTQLLERLTAGSATRMKTGVEAARRWMAQVNRAFYFGPAGYIWLGLVGLAGLIAVIALVRAIRRYRALRRTLGLRTIEPGEPGRLRQLGFYHDLLVALRRGGCTKPPWQPPLAFIGTLAAGHPETAEAARAAVELYYRGRYAGRGLTRAEVAEGRRLVAAVERGLRSGS
ncbi:MAG: DUF3488 domain-containing protein [Phycisphaerales bacterium]|nr:DUF3488 and transglutaminase-like domain-containing protein [Phycisphaerae bacterium]NNF42547.1 DUF3488 domain-containing protein [Phycisphaerales bacterium]NNM25089.1 DUF3488 domain-containing protein [Phycisphaerales bacterium]